MRRLVGLLLLALCLSAEARIPRDAAQIRAFRAEDPCPFTGLSHRLVLDMRWTMQFRFVLGEQITLATSSG